LVAESAILYQGLAISTNRNSNDDHNNNNNSIVYLRAELKGQWRITESAQIQTKTGIRQHKDKTNKIAIIILIELIITKSRLAGTKYRPKYKVCTRDWDRYVKFRKLYRLTIFFSEKLGKRLSLLDFSGGTPWHSTMDAMFRRTTVWEPLHSNIEQIVFQLSTILKTSNLYIV
jgi:hypothetical protein